MCVISYLFINWLKRVTQSVKFGINKNESSLPMTKHSAHLSLPPYLTTIYFSLSIKSNAAHIKCNNVSYLIKKVADKSISISIYFLLIFPIKFSIHIHISISILYIGYDKRSSINVAFVREIFFRRLTSLLFTFSDNFSTQTILYELHKLLIKFQSRCQYIQFLLLENYDIPLLYWGIAH